MFDDIRRKIRENRIAEALNDLDGLSLSREDASRLVNLHRRYRVYQDKAIGNLEEDRLLRIEENGIVEDVLVFLDMVEFTPKQVPAEMEGAAAGAGQEVVKSKGGAMRWLLPLLGLLLVAVVAFWQLQPDDQPTKPEAVPAREAPVNPSDNPGRTTDDTPVPETPAETPSRPGGNLQLNPEVLERIELKDVTDLKINRDLLKRVANRQALMTDGPLVPLAFAGYYNKKAPTEYNEALSRKLGGYVRSVLQREVSLAVLPPTFHTSELRERMVSRAAAGGDARLKATRTPYLLLLDVSKEQSGKALVQLSFFDVARQTGFNSNRQLTVFSANGSFTYGEMAAFLKEFLLDMRNRGLLK